MIRPINDQVVVKRLKEDEETAAGLYIPDAARTVQAEAEVIAVGRGRYTDAGVYVPMSVSVGDKVLLADWSGTEIEVDGVELLVVPESGILAVLDES